MKLSMCSVIDSVNRFRCYQIEELESSFLTFLIMFLGFLLMFVAAKNVVHLILNNYNIVEFSCNSYCSILKLLIFKYGFDSPKVKINLIYSKRDLLHYLLYDLQNDWP